MELRHLRYFVAVASELNFSRAAEKLLVAQPALSTQIADLEREIGTPLLFRNNRTVRLTAAGATFLPDAQAVLAAVDVAKTKALRASRGEVGELAIGFFAAPTMHFLPDVIRRFRATHPEVTINIRELTPDRQLVALERGELDLGFTRPLPPGNPDLEVETLFTEKLVLVTAETHPLASRRSVRLADLANEPFVLLERSVAISLYDQIITECRSVGFSPVVSGSPDLMATVLTMVAAEQGVSIVPEGVKNLRTRQVSFIPISPTLGQIPLVMCWRASTTCPPRNAFLDVVRECKSEFKKNYIVGVSNPPHRKKRL